jgi:hypothetical protein
MGSDGLPDYTHAWVTVDKVEVSGNGSSWATLSTTKKSVDLEALQNGHPVTLFSNVSAGAGTISYVRLTWGTVAEDASQGANFLTDSAGSHALAMPTQSVLDTSITISSGQLTTGQIMISATRAIQLRSTTSGGTTYDFQPTGDGHDLSSCATITGTVSVGGSARSGVQVFAQTLDGSLEPSICRGAVTDSNGTFVLEALPRSSSSYYYLVAQPCETGSAYLAQFAAVMASSSSTYTQDLAFTSATSPGAMELTVTPVSSSSQATWVELRQTFSNQALIVRSHPVTSATYDTVEFAGLYPGTYSVAAWRSTSGGTAVKKSPKDSSTGLTVAEAVVAGSTTQDTISYQ